MTGQPIVLLGASNLQRSFPVAVRVMQRACARPLSFHVAMGYGRSYGLSAGCFGKKFSGIFSCSIWSNLECAPCARPLAFVTDIGNDLGYEVDVETVFHWVRECVARLQKIDAQIVLTGLPLDSLRRVSRSKFLFFRNVLFPFSRLSHGELLDRAELLDARLAELAEIGKVPIFSVPNAWYGFDPIHYRACRYGAFWEAQVQLATRSEESFPAFPGATLRDWYLRLLRCPSSRGSCPPRVASPRRIRLHEGTELSLY